MLLRRQRQFGAGLRSDRAVDVKPGVQHAHFDQAIDPLFGQQVVEVGLAETRADSGQDLVVQTVLQALHGRVQHAGLAATLVADDFGSFHTDQRGDVAAFAQTLATSSVMKCPLVNT